MFVKFTCLFVIVSVLARLASSQDKETLGVRIAYKVYDECVRSDAGFASCLKKKAITFLDRIGRMEAISLSDGVSVVKSGIDNEISNESTVQSESELEKSLPRNLEARDLTLNKMLMDRISSFFSSRTLKISLPKITSTELSKSVEEGRGKMKKMMGMMMAGFAMKMAAMIPLAIAGLFVLAGKALITAKIALLLAGIIGLKKLLSQKGGDGGGHGGWQSGGGGGGGWDRRSIEDDNFAQSLAYRGFNQDQQI